MSDQSDAPVSTEPSDHVVTIPPELSDDDIDLYNRYESWLIGHLPASEANQRYESLLIGDLPASEANQWELLLESAIPRQDFPRVQFIMERTMDRASIRQASRRAREALWEPIVMNSLMRNWMNPVSFSHALQRVSQAGREHILMSSLMNSSTYTVSFRQALERVRQAGRFVELTIRQVRMLETYVRFFEDFDSLALPRQRQTREVWYDGWNGYGNPFGMNVVLPTLQANQRGHSGMNVDLPASQAYQRPPGEQYTVITLICTVSIAIYGLMLGLSGQMYKEEDGSFFSHHGVMVTVSMVSMIYAAFSAVFLCVIYFVVTADPTITYRRRMRFLLGSFFYAACLGPTVMGLELFVQPLGFKVFAWAVLGAALTLVGFYIGVGNT